MNPPLATGIGLFQSRRKETVLSCFFRRSFFTRSAIYATSKPASTKFANENGESARSVWLHMTTDRSRAPHDECDDVVDMVVVSSLCVGSGRIGRSTMLPLRRYHCIALSFFLLLFLFHILAWNAGIQVFSVCCRLRGWMRSSICGRMAK